MRLTGAWEVHTPHKDGGSYSALVALSPERLLAFSDKGFALEFSAPGSPARAPQLRPILSGRIRAKAWRDVEAATRDPHSGSIWIAFEGRNQVSRYDPNLTVTASSRPAAMRNWPRNQGAEALALLPDGRFLALGESNLSRFDGRDHPAVLFAGDPAAGAAAQALVLTGPDGFRPTDAAALPDGRVVVVMRRLLWPLPMQFGAVIALVDPDRRDGEGRLVARQLVRLYPPIPVDNFEGVAVVPTGPGRVTLWVISDDNDAVTQRSLLLRFDLAPADLPPK